MDVSFNGNKDKRCLLEAIAPSPYPSPPKRGRGDKAENGYFKTGASRLAISPPARRHNTTFSPVAAERKTACVKSNTGKAHSGGHWFGAIP